jgi:2-methylcitrate dehydratase PrpD
VRGHPLLRQRTDRPQVMTGREAQVSAQHAVAVALLSGRASLSEFSDASVGDPRIRALAGKVRLEDDPGIAVEGAIVRLCLRDGTSEEVRVTAAKASLANPLSDAEIETKACELAVIGCPTCDIVGLIEDVWALDRAKDAGALAANLRPRSP